MAELPERLYRRDRPPDPHFDPEEPLYHRCPLEGTEVDPHQPTVRRLKPSFLRFPEFSVNRGKYSEPEDVLLPSWADLGVARFLVKDVPEHLVADQSGTVIDFRTEHDPLEENYSHSEVRSYRGDQRIEDSSRVPKTVKSRFRQLLSERSLVVREPRA